MDIFARITRMLSHAPLDGITRSWHGVREKLEGKDLWAGLVFDEMTIQVIKLYGGTNIRQ